MNALSSNYEPSVEPVEIPANRSATSSPGARTKPVFSVKDGRPEVANLVFSFMALTDAAPLIVAEAKGFFKEHGLNVTLRRASSWTALRDAVNRGECHAAQMLFSMPLASACGLLGANQKPLIVPWVLSRNGQAITLRNSYKGSVTAEANALRSRVLEGRDKGRPLVFGHTLRIGTHALWLRYWLAAGGIHPGNDVALITVPPVQMVSNLSSSSMDGFCAGEPWHARAIADDIGYTATTSQEIWPDHPEKVFAFSEEFAAKNPRSVVAALKAIHQASAWLDDANNHVETATLLAGPAYLDCDPSWIKARLGETIAYGDGRVSPTTLPMTFARRGANRPRRSHAVWMLTQFQRWGLHYGPPDYTGMPNRVIRPEFHEAALHELGVVDVCPPDGPETFFDGHVFDPAHPEEYVRSFKLHNLIN